jgi:hypothetical protein
MGVSGCGKSMAAKVVAGAWDLPLVRLDMNLVLSGAYGAPEYIALELFLMRRAGGMLLVSARKCGAGVTPAGVAAALRCWQSRAAQVSLLLPSHVTRGSLAPHGAMGYVSMQHAH